MDLRIYFVKYYKQDFIILKSYCRKKKNFNKIDYLEIYHIDIGIL